jgi:enoyl-CoA hydratase/carnithine racemase
MDHITESSQGDIRIISMSSGKANALGPEMIEELLAAAGAASSDVQTRGLVLSSGRPRFFSPGFDVMRVFQFDRPTMSDFFGRFIDLYETLLATPKPVVAAISGHAVAGGAVLALMADERVMARGSYRFALMEVDLGVELPPKIMRRMIAAGGFRAAYDVLLAGAGMSPDQSLGIGLANELADESQVLERAVSRCSLLAAKPPSAFAAIKRSLQAEAGISQSKSDREILPRFLDDWFSAESVQARQKLVASMRA